MGVRSRANWHLSEIKPQDPAVSVEVMGLEIDLRQSPEELHKALEATVRRESRLYNSGVTCDLKMNGQSCHHCPEFTTDRQEGRAPLCQLGRRQEDLLKVIEIGQDSEYAELAEAVL